MLSFNSFYTIFVNFRLFNLIICWTSLLWMLSSFFFCGIDAPNLVIYMARKCLTKLNQRFGDSEIDDKFIFHFFQPQKSFLALFLFPYIMLKLLFVLCYLFKENQWLPYD